MGIKRKFLRGRAVGIVAMVVASAAWIGVSGGRARASVGGIRTQLETVTYSFTNFRSSVPGVWNSRPEVQGSVERLAGQLHDGERIIRL